MRKIKTAAGVAFIVGWLLCGCSVETIMDGGGVYALAGLVLVVVAITLGGVSDE